MSCHTNNSCNGMENGSNGNMRAPMNGNYKAPMNGSNGTPMNGRSAQNMQAQPRVQTQPMMPPMNGTVTSASPVPVPGSMPTTINNPYYTAGFLRQFIGKNMRVEYLIGTNGPLVDRVGTLVDVGADYIVLQPYLSDDLLMSDLFSIKFVTIYDEF